MNWMLCLSRSQLGACRPRAVERMGDPLHDPPQPFPASLPLPLRGNAEAQLQLGPAHCPVACVPVGRLGGRLRAGPPRGPCERAWPRAHVLLGALRARSPGRAGNHHGLLQAGQRAVAEAPAEPGHPGRGRWVRGG